MYCSRCGTWTPDATATCARCGETIAPRAPAPAGPEVVAAPPGSGPAQPTAAATRYAGFWRRAAAMLVDGVVLFFPDAIMRVSLGVPTAFTMQVPRDDQAGKLLTALVISTGVWWMYCGFLESSRWRGTLGQQLLGMRVGDLVGRRISFARATGRYFAQWLSVLLCGIGYLFNLWTARRQTLHDLVAGCVLLAPERMPVASGVVTAGQPS